MNSDTLTFKDRDRDRGAATVWVLAAGLVVALFAVAVVAIGAAITARHRAQAAADLSALAGAALAVEGDSAVCARARLIAEANAARLVECHVEQYDVVVTVEVAVPALGTPGAVAKASARAGPQ